MAAVLNFGMFFSFFSPSLPCTLNDDTTSKLERPS